MNCEKVRQRLDDYLDGELDTLARRAVREHLGGCAGCRARLDELQNLVARLADLPAPSPSAGFEDRVLQQARRAHEEWSQVRGHQGWLAAALAASLFAGVGIGLQVDRGAPETATLQPVAVVLDQPRTLKLLFRSAQDVDDVTFTLLLPEGVEVDGFPGRREISWQAGLRSGANLLPLPLVAHTARGGVLVTRVREGERSRTFRLDVRVQAPRETPGTGGI
jgi:hypothetical protein